jgi:hypothetical protein
VADTTLGEWIRSVAPDAISTGAATATTRAERSEPAAPAASKSERSYR